MKASSLREWLAADENLYRLRTEILIKPTRLNDAVQRLFPNEEKESSITALQALLELVAATSGDELLDEFLPSRLHYFLRAKLVCMSACILNVRGVKTRPAFFVSRKNEQTSKRQPIDECPDGCCPDCHPRLVGNTLLVKSCPVASADTVTMRSQVFSRAPTGLDDKPVLELAREVWALLTSKGLLFHLDQGDAWQLDHERLIVRKASARHECSRCGFITEYFGEQVLPSQKL